MEKSVIVEEQHLSRSGGELNTHAASSLIEFLESIHLIFGEFRCVLAEWVIRVRSHHGSRVVHLDSTLVVDG